MKRWLIRVALLTVVLTFPMLLPTIVSGIGRGKQLVPLCTSPLASLSILSPTSVNSHTTLLLAVLGVAQPSATNEAVSDIDLDGIPDDEDPDIDGDGIENELDNCVRNPNPCQRDVDSDSEGNHCDPDIDGDGVLNEDDPEMDGDGIDNSDDNCPAIPNPMQEDADDDGVGDPCDPDIDGDDIPNEDEADYDSDADAVPDLCDNCPTTGNVDQQDEDRDGIGDACESEDPTDDEGCTSDDPCARDSDGDGIGDPCDSDIDGDGIPNTRDDDMDGDGIPNSTDVCPSVPDLAQRDRDGDGIGNACDADLDGDGTRNDRDPDRDSDGDGVETACDNCPEVANPSQRDVDEDSIGDGCDNCLETWNPDQVDRDADGVGDVCDSCPDDASNDEDEDGVCGSIDNCPSVRNTSQTDSDQDGIGNVCDTCPSDAADDADADGLCADRDNCPSAFNPNQEDGDGDGLGDACDACYDLRAPGSLSASDAEYCDRIVLTWGGVAEATKYEIRRATSPSGTYTEVGTTSATTYEDATASPATDYFYKVRATSDCDTGPLSNSDAGIVDGAPGVPDGVSATDSTHCDKVTVSWSSVDGATEYDVRRATSSGGSYGSLGTTASTSFDDTTAVPGTTYYYKVLASNGCGSSAFSDYDAGARDDVLPAPGNVAATHGTECDWVAVSWDAVTGASSYDVQRATSCSGSYALLGSTGTTSYQDTSATRGTNYFYKVSAVNDCGAGSLSECAFGFRHLEPETPTGVSATDGAHEDRVTVTWDTAAGAQGYDIYRSTSSGGSYSMIGWTASPSTSYDDTTTSTCAVFYYKVLSSNAGCGLSELSDDDAGYRGAPPATPTSVSATDGTSCDKVTVSWGSVTGATEYDVRRATSSGGSYSSLGTTASTSYDDTTATPGTTYFYKVLSSNGCGSSALSSYDDGSRDSAPGVPSSVSATDGTYCDKVTVSWGSVTGATEYDVRRATSSDGSYSSLGTTASTSYDDTTATPGTTYYYKVLASNGCGASSLSEDDAGSRDSAPGVPSSVSATDDTHCDKVTVSWGSVTGATEYDVRRATSSGGSYSSLGTTASSSYDDTTATLGITYFYKVLASNSCGSSVLSDYDEGSRDSAPGVPSSVSATDDAHCDRVTVSWGSVTGSTEYDVRRATSSGGSYSSLGTTASSSYDDTTATPGTTYFYKVLASNTCGSSALSDYDEGSRDSAPGVPTGVSATDDTHCDRVTVSWGSVTGAAEYDVRRATSSGGSYSSLGTTASTSYDDTTATPGTTYYYKLLASNGCGSSALSGDDAGSRDSVPGVPSNVSATDDTYCDKVTVSWSTVTGATAYDVRRATSSGGSYSSLGTTASTSYEDTTATPGTMYYYKVLASNGCGSSASSGYAAGSRESAPGVPSSVSATDDTHCDKVSVSWGSVTGATEYDVRRATSSGGSYSSLGTTVSTSYNDTTATPGTTYYYKVLASNSCGSSALSGYDSGSRNAAPEAPSGVSASDATYCDKVAVSWGSVTGATEYDVRRATSSGGSYSSLGTTASTSYDDTTATPGTTYYYKVLASNACGSSTLSSYDDGSRDATPDTPTNVRATDGTRCDSVKVAWNHVEGRSGYDVYRATSSGGSYSKVGSVGSAEYQYYDSSAADGSTYYYKVAATNGCGSSALSDWDSGYRLATVQNVEASDGTDCTRIQISWDTLPGNTGGGYQVHRATSSSGPYTAVRVAWPGDSWGDTSATPGVTYYYKVAAESGGCFNLSDWDDGYRGVEVSPPSWVDATDGDFCDEITVTWESVSGATNYYVRWATSSGGPYNYLAQTSGTSYDHAAPDPDVTYFYKVRAYGDCGWTSDSTAWDDGYRTCP